MNKILLLIIISGFCGGSFFTLIKIAEAHDIPRACRQLSHTIEEAR